MFQCYKLFSEQLSHDLAQYQCQCTGGYTLANIPSAEVNTFLTSLVGEQDAWIGLTDQTTEGTYLWSDATSLAGYSNWKAGQPSAANSGVQDCVKIMGGSAGLWDDILCSKTLAFVCESSVPSSSMPPSPTCTTPTTGSATVTAASTEHCEAGWFHYAAGGKCVRLFTEAEVGINERLIVLTVTSGAGRSPGTRPG